MDSTTIVVLVVAGVLLAAVLGAVVLWRAGPAPVGSSPPPEWFTPLPRPAIPEEPFDARRRGTPGTPQAPPGVFVSTPRPQRTGLCRLTGQPRASCDCAACTARRSRAR